MAAAVFLLVIFSSSFRSVLPSTIEDNTRTFKNCLPLYCGNIETINTVYTYITPSSTNITLPSSCEPFSVVNCDDGPPLDIRLTGGVGAMLYDFESISNVSLSFINENKEFQGQLNSTLCNSFNNLNLSSLNDAASGVLSGLNMFVCNRSVEYTNPVQCRNVSIHYILKKNESLPSLPAYCSVVNLQVSSSNYNEIFGLITAKVGFEEYRRIKCYNCRSGGRICEAECVGANGNEVVEQEPQAPKISASPPAPSASSAGSDRALSPADPPSTYSSGIEGNNTEKWLIIAPSAAGVGIIVIAVYCCARRLSSYKSKDDNCIKEFLKNYGPLALKRYSYSEVKKMTWSFKDRLGQGGYGSVFKGKLPDGCLVAVKVLEKSKGNGAEFINEVASISRTSYVNIVTLLGFCFDGSKRALIYEFMPNGSLDKYIYKENAAIAGHQLDCEKLYQIALGVARGLEYLHRGCNTRILHFDIKPQNILLDENFCPKISDFGLAKICPKRESNISMKDARGTIGYIAPEVFYRNFGRVSHKSDVYSYGMLVLEMIGGRQSLHIVVDNTSELYFPDWIHKRLEFGEELGLPGIDGEEENNVARKMVLVSLWCIQTNPLNRPPMNRVVEMLQASLESLPIPPRPYMSSPPRAPEISGASSQLLSSELLAS